MQENKLLVQFSFFQFAKSETLHKNIFIYGGNSMIILFVFQKIHNHCVLYIKKYVQFFTSFDKNRNSINGCVATENIVTEI